ncbi:hypothetical protein QP794_02650 [Paenibacillus sp. UMB7766-LJ446]|uniref:hypothetical protein n=1 Tax=Paenibacillus sp. UMB7766-LJ446 TaxID=3046313 RepID=UPI00254A17C1|nr:hypothetical protein [Paenibacillus sp. UMB7766-LJ446]MDK8188985.1 hypothetical protein [Paenibacillus sp. UMB7766-LJ446]
MKLDGSDIKLVENYKRLTESSVNEIRIKVDNKGEEGEIDLKVTKVWQEKENK